MAKNYKKIYNRLIKEIKHELKAHKNNSSMESCHRLKLLDEIEFRYAITILEMILDWTRELEGKECLMMNMNQKEFKEWKKKITFKEKKFGLPIIKSKIKLIKMKAPKQGR